MRLKTFFYPLSMVICLFVLWRYWGLNSRPQACRSILPLEPLLRPPFSMFLEHLLFARCVSARWDTAVNVLIWLEFAFFWEVGNKSKTK
jgi:hypothetical protein